MGKDDAAARLLVGCVADDFTGAGDVASYFARGGLRTLLLSGVSDVGKEFCGDAEAIVIALKSRTEETQKAVRDSMKAFDWLKKRGAQTLYFKYCSTFDSRPCGNIGPVVDAVMESYDIPYTLLCPAFLENGRSTKGGTLYVNGVPLAETGMRHHPLNPMWDSRIANLMSPQGKYYCTNVSADELADTADQDESKDLCAGKLGARLAELQMTHEHFYLSVDFYRAEHGRNIMRVFPQLPFYTGASGLAFELARSLAKCDGNGRKLFTEKNTAARKLGRVLLVGSCSDTTVAQVRSYLKTGGRSIMLEPEKLLAGEQDVDCVWKKIIERPGEDILIYSSGSIGKRAGGAIDETKADVLERTLALLARRAVDYGFKRIVAGGGETSGAITKALGYFVFRIGESVSPGVPIMSPVGGENLFLVLKSGNFGDEEFFNRALV